MSKRESNNEDVVRDGNADISVDALPIQNLFCDVDTPLIEAYRKGFRNEDVLAARAKTPSGWSQAILIAEPEPVPIAFQEVMRSIKLCFSTKQIAQRVKELGTEISTYYADATYPLVVLGVLKGCSPFLSDLLRAMNPEVPMEVDFIHASFYGDRTSASAEGSIILPSQTELTGKNVLIVDDILDTGSTLHATIAALSECNPNSIKACVFLEKLAHNCQYIPELRYRGFQIRDGWAVGYGMDYHQYYRNLPYIGVLQGNPLKGDED